MPGKAIAETAARHFRQRQALAAKAVAQGRWTAERANDEVLPWLAIAAAAGADLPELSDPRTILYPWDRAGQVEAVRLCAEDVCPRERWHAVLARGRDAAVGAAGDEASLRRARELLSLSVALGVFTPPQPEASTTKDAA